MAKHSLHGMTPKAIGIFYLMHKFPGIKSDDILKDYDIGRSSLRTAFKELKDSGLIEFHSRIGYTVANRVASQQEEITPLPKKIKRVEGGSPKKRIEKALQFYDEQIQKSNGKQYHNAYCDFFSYLDGGNPLEERLDHILLVPQQLKYEKFEKIFIKAKELNRSIKKMMDSMANNKKYTKDKESLFMTLNNWLNRD